MLEVRSSVDSARAAMVAADLQLKNAQEVVDETPPEVPSPGEDPAQWALDQRRLPEERQALKLLIPHYQQVAAGAKATYQQACAAVGAALTPAVLDCVTEIRGIRSEAVRNGNRITSFGLMARVSTQPLAEFINYGRGAVMVPRSEPAPAATGWVG